MKSPLTHLLLAIVVGVATCAAYGFWYVMVSQKSADVAALDQKIVAANEDIKRVAAANTALAEISGDETKVQSYFVSDTGMGSPVKDFVNALQALGDAEKSQVNVLLITPGTSSAQPSLVLNLSIQGTFDAVMRTLGAIEYAPYDLTISNVTIQKNDKNSWQTTLTIVVGSSPASAPAK